MSTDANPFRDRARLQALRDTGLLDSPPDEAFDRLTRLAARMLDAPLAFVKLMDDRREFTKSCFVPSHWTEDREAPLEDSLCVHAVNTREPLRLYDAAEDSRASVKPLVAERGVRSYLGVPLIGSEGYVFGAFCVAMFGPRSWSDHEVELLRDLAACATSEIELRARARAHASEQETLACAKADAERANAAKTEFLSRMSHELRTPLNAILGFGQLLEMEIGSEGDRESVEHILKAGHHLLRLIDDVLDIARIETGKVRLSIEPVPVREAILESWSLMRGMAAERSVTSGIHFADGPEPVVWADDQRLRQVLLNLFSNAIKYNREGGKITVSCSEIDGRTLRVEVRDTGEGIQASQLERLFVPFERLDAARRGVQGTGLGLALSKGLVEAMSGSFSARSVEGEGSTFSFELPLVPAGELPLAAAGASGAEAAFSSPRWTVLLIEDNLANSRLVAHVLRRRPDVRLISAMQGRRGLELARQHRPELIILDLNLPDVSGRSVLSDLRRDAELHATPVIMISGGAVAADIEQALDLGASAFLLKPFDLQELMRAVDECLHSAGG
jgi:signal transduction histidine kinase/CheY-like chemotaxis protein